MSESVKHIVALAGRVSLRAGFLQMFELLQGLAAEGREVTLLCHRIRSELASREVSFTVRQWPPAAAHWPSTRGEAAFAEVLPERIQIIHVHGGGLGRAGRKFLNSTAAPVVFTPHAALSDWSGAQRIQRRSSKVIALSESMREGLLNRGRVPRKRIALVPPGIDVHERATYSVDTNGRPPVIGTVAPLEIERGGLDFLDAARLLADSGLSAHFVVAGDGPAEGRLRRHADRLGLNKSVTFVTNLAEYAPVIEALDIYVRPNAVGGIGHTLLQAMAMGKPVVVVATAGVLEIVEDGVAGRIVPKESVPDLASAIADIVKDAHLAQGMAQAAHERVTDRFSREHLVRKTLKVYSEALACAQQ